MCDDDLPPISVNTYRRIVDSAVISTTNTRWRQDRYDELHAGLLNGLPLSSVRHPNSPWWKRILFWLRLPKLSHDSIETVTIETPGVLICHACQQEVKDVQPIGHGLHICWRCSYDGLSVTGMGPAPCSTGRVLPLTHLARYAPENGRRGPMLGM